MIQVTGQFRSMKAAAGQPGLDASTDPQKLKSVKLQDSLHAFQYLKEHRIAAYV